MAELKTQKTTQPAEEFLANIEPEAKRQEGMALLKLFKQITGEKPVMWGTSIVGFGQYHYKSERSAQEGDWPLVGFSPRKQNLTLYVMAGNQDNAELLKNLGKHTSSVGCLYIKKLADIDLKTLSKLVKNSYDYMKKTTSKS